MNLPRTQKDFVLLDCWAWAGYSDKKTQQMLEKWGSEVITLAGKLHCSHCYQPITTTACIECGQTIYERNS